MNTANYRGIKSVKTFEIIISLLLCMSLLFCLYSCGTANDTASADKVKVLIVPKFEIDGISGDFPGEAQLFYEKYCPGIEKTVLPNMPEAAEFYYNDENGVALLITGSGKTAVALAMTAVLSDSDYDFSESYVVSVGCSGGNFENTTLGDVVIVTGACDNELGHTADIREFDDKDREVTWFYDNSYDSTSKKMFDQKLADKAFDMTGDVSLETTEVSKRVLKANFPDDEWRLRKPAVLKGTALSGDSYWKGIYGHKNALAIIEQYKMPEPYAVTEMEELTMANVLECYGMLDRLVSFRVVVDLDVFLSDDSPEKLWLGTQGYNESVDEQGSAAIDIFEIGMHNLFDVSEVMIDNALDGNKK